ncbi:hypothetical protein [Arthrobacter sp. Sr24]
MGENKGMDIPWFPITTAAVALIGVLAGSLLTRTNEHKQWLRNEKLSVYTAYLEEFGTIQISNYFEMVDSAQDVKKMLALIDSVHRICLRVIVVAPVEIMETVQESLNDVMMISSWASDLPTRLGEKYFVDGMTEQERSEADEALTLEAAEMLHEKMLSFSTDGYKRIETIANLMRQDLNVGDNVPNGFFQRVIEVGKVLTQSKVHHEFKDVNEKS